MKATNAEAQSFKALHVPGKPLLLANVHDAASAHLVASMPTCRALATASFSVALANGTEDAKLKLETQLSAVEAIAAVAREHNKPLTVDLQAGYADQLEEAIVKMVELGVVGVNIEDSDQTTNKIVDEHTAVERIKTAIAAATKAGLPDFVVNARSDTFLKEGNLEEAIQRGKAYLEAGATTVYILGHGARECTREEVERMVRGLDGRLNIAQRLPSPANPQPLLKAQDLIELGVARVSVGPQLYFAAIQAMKAAASAVMIV